MWLYLRDGSWLTRERLRIYCAMLAVAYALVLALWFGLTRGPLDWQDRPLGNDFASFYSAGTFVHEGHPEKPYHPDTQFARERELFGPATALYVWSYPPQFLAVAGLLATMPYLAAFFAWTLSTLAFSAAMTWRLLPRRETLLAAVALPAGFINFAHGQTGFLAAGLFAGGLSTLERRPVIAGLLFSLLAFKPQYGLLIPFALLAGRCWTAFAAASAGLVLTTAAAWVGFGPDASHAFLGNLEYARRFWLEYSITGFYKMQSLFAAVRMLGGPVALAYALHSLLLGVVVIGVVATWRYCADASLRGAALLVGALLATPYTFDYDMTLMGPAIALVVARGLAAGFLPYEKTLLAFAFLAPLAARNIALVSDVPLGLVAECVLFGLVLRRAAAEFRQAPAFPFGKMAPLDADAGQKA